MPEPLQSYVIKPYARMEMRRRQITEEQVRAVLSAPGQILPAAWGRRIYQSRLFVPEAQKEYLFRVVVDFGPTPPEVVTVYRTSKIEKYWRARL